eukprot:552369-Pelagomonas_calceolata.AAC.2
MQRDLLQQAARGSKRCEWPECWQRPATCSWPRLKAMLKQDWYRDDLLQTRCDVETFFTQRVMLHRPRSVAVS